MCGFGMQSLEDGAAARDVFTAGCLEKIVGWTRTNVALVGGLTAGLLLLEVSQGRGCRQQGAESRPCLHRCVSSVWPPPRSPSSERSGSTGRTGNHGTGRRRRTGRRASGFLPSQTSRTSEGGVSTPPRGGGASGETSADPLAVSIAANDRLCLTLIFSPTPTDIILDT